MVGVSVEFACVCTPNRDWYDVGGSACPGVFQIKSPKSVDSFAGYFLPNDRSCIRLIGALAMEQSEEWLTGRRYLDMNLLEEVDQPPIRLTGTD